MSARYVLSSMACACALGRTNGEVLANALKGDVSGLVALNEDVKGRTLLHGMVPGELPVVENPEFDMRSCRLLKHAIGQMGDALRDFLSRYRSDRVAVILGASTTGIDEAEAYIDGWFDTGKIDPGMRYSMIELGTPADFLAKELGVTGPAYVISTACSSSAKVFSDARRLIEAGVVDAAIVGGVDSRCRFAMNGFAALGALSSGMMRPCASDRDGICLGEAVALFTMERGEKGVFFAGAGETSDAYHPTAPDPEGRGAEAAMRAALADAGLTPDDIDYVNLHGTGTLANDSMELKAVSRVFGERVPIACTKPMTGHALGAAGAIEAALGWLMLSNGVTVPHVSFGVPDPALPVFTPARGAEKVRNYLSNSFAFGGSNASVILSV